MYDHTLTDEQVIASVLKPATWATLIVGVAMIGCAARRRSQNAGSVIADV